MPAAAPGREDAEARTLRGTAMGMFEKVDALYAKIAVAAANDAALEVVRAIDTFIEQTQPFKLAKDESQRERLGMILYYCAEALRIASLGLAPVLPGKMAELWQLLGIAYDTKSGDLAKWCEWGRLQPGSIVQKGAPLFPRIQT
jgi:methionyl-tRNA synthetase